MAKTKIKKRDIVMVGLILVVGFLSWWTNHNRVLNGFFISDSWIFWDGLFYTIFSALIVGYVVAKILGGKH